MEDLFRRYTTDGASTLSLVIDNNDGNKDDDDANDDDDVVMLKRSDDVVERTVNSGRFRAKEDLERTVDEQTKTITHLQHELRMKEEVDSRAEKLASELHTTNKQLLLSQQSFMELSLELDARLEENKHLAKQIERMEQEEDHACKELARLEDLLKQKDDECKEIHSAAEECAYKMESFKRECNEYKSVLEEQERLMQDAHENSSVMQRNFNEMLKEISEKDESLKETRAESEALVIETREIRGLNDEREQVIQELRDELKAEGLKLDNLENEKVTLKNQVSKFLQQEQFSFFKASQCFVLIFVYSFS